jgi:hypothetical protein
MIGPGSDVDVIDAGLDLREIRPSDAFQCGVLFPISEHGIDPGSTSDDSEDSLEEGFAFDNGGDAIGDQDKEVSAVKIVRYVPPSSVGFSFYVEGSNIELEVQPWAVRYEPEGGDERNSKRVWKRTPIARADEIVWSVGLPSSGSNHLGSSSYPVFRRTNGQDFGGHSHEGDESGFLAMLQALWRPHGKGWIVTISLSNIQRMGAFEQFPSADDWVKARESSTLFESELSCRVVSGVVGDYPRTNPSLMSAEDRELAIQFRHNKVFAVGHGAGADWIDEDGVTIISTSFMPIAEIPQVTADTGSNEDLALDLDHLATIVESQTNVISSLKDFQKAYEVWVKEQTADATIFHEDEAEAAQRIVGRMAAAAKRIEAGIRLLEEDDNARQAFAVANRAMALQMRQGRKIAQQEPRTPRWRPFQLGFLLMVLESSIREDCDDRDLVDLIWFPTGGGKTEAYLALVAFIVTWRRLMFSANGAGTAVLMRYTLRLLTGQQFERASRLIFALEHLRRIEPNLGLGSQPITIGIWVGGSTSPNSFRDAKDILAKAQARAEIPRQFLLTHCPWCGSPFSPDSNYLATQDRFDLLCRNTDCDFNAGANGIPLPCNVVDEALYKHPPTLLIGTIDKFARLAWAAKTTAFFGMGSVRPPELIIQDELHLIAGPLGSVAGIYEAAIDTVINAKGVRPKYIASTATIRNASEQVSALYARQAAIFPPPGLDEKDSWFARAIPVSDENPGRLYVGYLAPARRRDKAIAPLAATLLQAPAVLFNDQADREILLDAWWTLISYHGSLKGVGAAYNALEGETHEYLRFLQQKQKALKNSAFDRSPSAKRKNSRSRLESKNRVQQLTSLVDAGKNAETFARLAKNCFDRDSLDIAVSTNMISVGVDVARLAVMIVNGQPLTTAEYIQASSRVGRGEVPGIVFANYYRDQARSLSHYENFRAYHESFYRHVEPTSVSPFSYPCRHRCLHAALVIVMRHAAGLLAERDVERFDSSDEIQMKLIDSLARRCGRADPSRSKGINAHLDSLQARWMEFVADNRGCSQMQYSANDSDGTGVERLLCDFEAKIGGVWKTLQSMRNVEHTALVKLL